MMQELTDAWKANYEAGWAATAQRVKDQAASDAVRNNRFITALENESKFWLSSTEKVRVCVYVYVTLIKFACVTACTCYCTV
jgi:hypothetical protein